VELVLQDQRVTQAIRVELLAQLDLKERLVLENKELQVLLEAWARQAQLDLELLDRLVLLV
jgi:hypothetical protein